MSPDAGRIAMVTCAVTDPGRCGTTTTKVGSGSRSLLLLLLLIEGLHSLRRPAGVRSVSYLIRLHRHLLRLLL